MAGITCSSCGGKMVFDVMSQGLKCEFCGAQKDITAYHEKNTAEEHKETYDQMVFTCRNCGAELIALDEEAVAYCSYCGSEAMLDGKYQTVMKPKKIIPFKVSKQAVKNAYANKLKGKAYVPKDYKNPEFLEGFRGIYLPYYSYRAVVQDRTIVLTGTKSYLSGGYDYYEEYDVTAELGGITEGISYDASIAFDDTIANEIAPFDQKKECDYQDPYLAGFYADKATTNVGTYIEDVTTEAVDKVYQRIGALAGSVSVGAGMTPEQKKESVGIDSFECDVKLYPVWFLTWKNKDRVAYSIVNGESGKVAMDIPVDKKKFFLVSAIAAAAVFLLLSVLPVFILPKALMSISAILLMISAIVLRGELVQIFDKENHVYDYGDVSHAVKKKKMKKAPVKTKKQGQVNGCLIGILTYVGIMVISFIAVIIEAVSDGLSAFSKSNVGITIIIIAALVVTILQAIREIKCVLGIQNKIGLVPSLFAPLALMFSFAIALINPAHDFWYYGAALASMVGLLLNALTAVAYFNYLTTRPVPNFFTREGADNGK